MANDHNMTVEQVEKIATSLCSEYRNPKFFAWYCGAIYEFGEQAIEDARARVKDARDPGRLFTRIINDWREEKKRRQNRNRLHGQKKG